MAKPKKQNEPELPKQPEPLAPLAPAPTPLREYLAGGEMMRVTRFDFLEVEFTGLLDNELPLFHETLSIHTRGWMILRRLFGILPVIPKRGTLEDDLRTWQRPELLDKLGLTASDLKEELERLRGVWNGTKKPVTAPVEKAEEKEGLDFEADRLVKEHGMGDLLKREEVPWMAGRLIAYGVMLSHPQVGEMVRMTLLTELDLRRLQIQRTKLSKELNETADEQKRKALEREYDWVYDKLADLLPAYDKQVRRIDEVFPFMKQSAGALNFRAVASDMVVCHAAWERDPANRPVDGVYTVGEVEVLCRTSLQAPEPQYRAGQVIYLNEARAHLFDPNWRGLYRVNTLKKVDAAWKTAAMEISSADGETLTDLASDDPAGGEYPPLRKMQNAE